MKLLSLRLCAHDSNFTYFDGHTVRYFKSERFLQIKHHAYNNLWEWRDTVKKVWGLDYNEIEQIALIIEPNRHNLSVTGEDCYPYIPYDLFPSSAKVYRLDHHLAHAFSSWMLYENEPNTHIVVDGSGDGDVGHSYSIIQNKNLIQRDYVDLAKNKDSIGRKMIDLGDFLGIKRSNLPEPSDGLDTAGKLMSLQAYGKIDKSFIKNYLENYNFYNHEHVFDFTNWISYKGDERLACLSALDWAATIHYYLGQIIKQFFSNFVSADDKFTYSGGVAQNIVWNTVLKEHFKNIIIPPHCGDEGLSLGGIEFLRQLNNLPKFSLDNFPFIQSDEYVMPADQVTINHAAQLLSKGKIVAWYQGNGEIGPRALGNRSILFDPRIKNTKQIINKIKNRENYRPFGGAMIASLAQNLFDIPFDDPYMLYTFKVKDKSLEEITHVDGTCRVQCVQEGTTFYSLIQEFYKLTNYPVLLNTSLNTNGKPIAGFIQDAIDFFEVNLEVDALVIGNKLYLR